MSDDIPLDVFSNNIVPYLDLNVQRKLVDINEYIRDNYNYEIFKIQQKIYSLSTKRPLLYEKGLLYNTLLLILTNNDKEVIADIAQDSRITNTIAKACILANYPAYLQYINYQADEIASFIETLSTDKKTIMKMTTQLVTILSLYPDIVHRIDLDSILAITTGYHSKTMINLIFNSKDNVWSHPALDPSGPNFLVNKRIVEKHYDQINNRLEMFSGDKYTMPTF